MTAKERKENEITANIMAAQQTAVTTNGIKPAEPGHRNVMVDRLEAMVADEDYRDEDCLLEAMLADEDYRDEDCLPPTAIAVDFASHLFADAARAVEFTLPAGSVLPDGEGGLRCRWVSGNRELRVAIHGSKESKSYLYRQQGEEHDVEHPPSSDILVQWLR